MKRNRVTVPQSVFTLELKVITVPADGWDGWEVRFAFHAVDAADALDKAKDWAIYHSFPMEDVRVRPATEEETQYRLHDEYLR